MNLTEKKNQVVENLKHNVKKVSPRVRVLDKASEIADVVLSKEEKYAKMSMPELRNLSYRMMDEIKDGAPLDNFLIDALAIAREVIFRVHKMKAFRVQIIGAIVAHFGDFAEMKTGEGKTLTLLLVSYVNALTKKGVHIVTVNEYLVERDMKFSEQALGELGISVGYILSSMQPEQKKKMYACDITYVSNSELGFDYLRDNMVQDINEKMQRELNFAIVDEADSVLIDESRTPLIIAANPDEGLGMYLEADKFVKSLTPDDYVIDLESHAINLNDNGIKKTEANFNIKNLYDIENSELVHKIMNALRANYIMELGKEYIIKTSKKTGKPEIALVDSFTGRVMEGRMYSAGLHQAIQAKEGVDIEPENVTVATITYQSFFRLYKKIAGFSGTALTEKNEFLNIYNMVVVDIPTNKPVVRIDQPDYIFGSKQMKWKYVVAEIKRRHEKGQPVLVGTVSVEDSELLHRLLDHIHIPHTVLNAKNNSVEAEIVKNAGQKGAVTIATNMAGRGTDIKLGEGVKELGGLYVLGTERNESRRIDNQLRGRSGRQGDPGESRFFISLQDSLFKRFANDRFDKAQFKLGEEVIDLKFFSKLLDRTQKRVENMNFDIRKNLIDYDYVLSEQRELIYKQRNNILSSNNLFIVVQKMVPRVVDVIISLNRDQENVNMVNIDNMIADLRDKIDIDVSNYRQEFKDKNNNQIHSMLTNYITKKIKQKYEEKPAEEVNNEWRKILISSLDKNWTKFLDRIQKLRDGVVLRSYEQKSPLNIYVEDSDRLFYNITISIAEEVITSILKSGDSTNNQTKIELKLQEKPVHTIDELELSTPANPSEVANNKNIIEKENEMDNKDKNNLQSNIDDVVEQILGKTTNSTIVEEKATKDVPVVETEVVETIRDIPPPPPIPNSQKTTTPPPPPIPSKPIETKKSDDNDFLKQVMNVVDHDIDAKPVDLSLIDEIIKEEKTTTPINNPTSTPLNNNPTPVNNSPIKTETTIIYEKPIDGRFVREDELKLESYHHNIRIEPENEFTINNVQRALDNERAKIVDEKYNSIISVKDENIKNLVQKSIDLEKQIENNKLDYSKQIEEMFEQENKKLREMKDQYSDLLEKKESLEKTIYDFQMKELEAEHEKLLAEKDAIILERRKLEEERKFREEQERKEAERIEKEKQAALEQERIKAQQEELAKQRAMIEELLAQQLEIERQRMQAQMDAIIAANKASEEQATNKVAPTNNQSNATIVPTRNNAHPSLSANNQNARNRMVSLAEAKKFKNENLMKPTGPKIR